MKKVLDEKAKELKRLKRRLKKYSVMLFVVESVYMTALVLAFMVSVRSDFTGFLFCQLQMIVLTMFLLNTVRHQKQEYKETIDEIAKIGSTEAESIVEAGISGTRLVHKSWSQDEPEDEEDEGFFDEY